MTLIILLVGGDKELPEFKDAIESCKAVGPIRVFSATKAVEAAGQLQKAVQQCGVCHAAFLHNNFTMKGKEEFSDVIKKLLRDKYPGTPLIAWGNMKKAGTEGKDYNYGMEWSSKAGDSASTIARTLSMVKNKEIKTDFVRKGDKGGSKDPIKKSIDVVAPASTDNRRKSMEGGSPELNKSGSARLSLDVPSPPVRRKSMETSPTMPVTGQSKGSPSSRLNQPQVRQSLDVGAGASPRMSAFANSTRMSFDSRMMGSPGSYMGGMSGMGAMPSMASMSAMSGMTALPSMSRMTGGMPGMGGMQGMGGMPSMGGIQAMPSMTSGVGGMPSMGGMPTMGGMYGGMVRTPGGFGAMSAPAQNSGQMAGHMGTMGLSGGEAAPPSANSELIKALADEVHRLKLMVEEKRMAEAAAVGMGVGS